MASRVAFGTVSWFFDPVFQVPAVLEKGVQVIEGRRCMSVRAFHLPKRMQQAVELRHPNGHAHV
jgi:hypothetical protein